MDVVWDILKSTTTLSLNYNHKLISMNYGAIPVSQLSEVQVTKRYLYAQIVYIKYCMTCYILMKDRTELLKLSSKMKNNIWLGCQYVWFISWRDKVDFSVSARSPAPNGRHRNQCGDRRANFLIASSKLSVARPKICLFLLWCAATKFAATTLAAVQNLAADKKPLLSLFCYFVYVRAAAAICCVPRRPAFVCAISSSARSRCWKTICSSFGQDIDRERHLHLCHSHKKLVHPRARLSLSSRLSQIVKQVASPPFVFSGSQSALSLCFLRSVLIIVAILMRSRRCFFFWRIDLLTMVSECHSAKITANLFLTPSGA
jgi:hypothetical protein